jgi:hypothetical protein
MNDEEIEAYLRTHTFNGAVRDLQAACMRLKAAMLADMKHVISAIRLLFVK